MSHATKPESTCSMPKVLRFAGLWVIYACWCQAAGWSLSALKALHSTGYLAASPVLFAALFIFWRSTRPHHCPCRTTGWMRRIKKSPSFTAWCVVSALILTGALINPPSNYDGLTYRLPKLLYWLQENQWHWIDGIDFRLNITGAGIEWMSAPFLLFTHSDRGLFLLNFIPFLLLPGLFFVAARGLGIRTRTARWWMWVWPMAYGIALQAGSIGNDMLAAALGLASLAFAAQAPRSRPFLCMTFSALAAAAMTSIKATALPMGLPIAIFWFWAGFQALGIRRTLLAGITAGPVAVLASFLPMAVVCSIHTGRWNGNPNDRHGFEPENPVAALIGNGIEFATGTLQPPLLPASHAISRTVFDPLNQTGLFRWIRENYKCFGPSFNPELPSEESAGIGLGITFTMFVWAFTRSRTRLQMRRHHPYIMPGFVAGVLAAMAAFMIQSGVGGTSRLMVPLTPFVILAGLLSIQLLKPRSGFQSRTCISVIPALFVLPSLFLNPNRPIIHASSLLALPFFPVSVQSRIRLVEESYAIRSDAFAPLLKRIPDAEAVAYGGDDHPLTSMFRPFRNQRRVVELLPSTQKSVTWVIGLKSGIEKRMGMPLDEWESTSGFVKVHETILAVRATTGRESWYLYHRPATNP